MPDINLSPLDAQQAAINRKRMLAQALQQMSMQPIQAPQVPGAQISPAQGIAQLAQALVASYKNKKLDKEQSSLSDQYQADRTAQAANLTDSAIPQPQGSHLSMPVPQMQEAQIPGENAVPAQPAPMVSQSVTMPVSDKQKTARERLVQILAAGVTSQDPTIKQLAMGQIQEIQKTGSEGEAFKREMAKQLSSQNFAAEQAGLNRDVTRQGDQLGHQDRQAELAQAMTLANRPKPFTAGQGDQFGSFDPASGAANVQGTVPSRPAPITGEQQKISDFNADPELTKKYGTGTVGLARWEQAMAIEKAVASKVVSNGLPQATGQRVGQIASQFDSHPIVKNYNETANRVDTVKRILDSKVGGPGDLATVFEFMKGLDPNSVVRESEFDSAAKSGNIFSGIFSKFNGYLKPSGGFLPDQVKKDFQSILDQKLKANESQYRNLRNEAARKIDKWTGGNDGEEYLTEYQKGGGATSDINSVLDKVFGPPPTKK